MAQLTTWDYLRQKRRHVFYMSNNRMKIVKGIREVMNLDEPFLRSIYEMGVPAVDQHPKSLRLYELLENRFYVPPVEPPERTVEAWWVVEGSTRIGISWSNGDLTLQTMEETLNCKQLSFLEQLLNIQPKNTDQIPETIHFQEELRNRANDIRSQNPINLDTSSEEEDEEEDLEDSDDDLDGEGYYSDVTPPL